MIGTIWKLTLRGNPILNQGTDHLIYNLTQIFNFS